MTQFSSPNNHMHMDKIKLQSEVAQLYFAGDVRALTYINMDPIQKEFERGIGDRFIEWWFNIETGENYYFAGRADRAPDLIYSSRGSEIQIEVTAAYYDNEHAAFLWKGARGAPDAPADWSGINAHKSLAEAISKRIVEKSQNRYGPNTVLLIQVPPGVTTSEELASLLSKKILPSQVPFVGVYVVGRFPTTLYSAGGYRVIPLKEVLRVRVG
ncbi:hypothetical protein R2Q26_01640 [Nitrosomonas sp. Is37]|nr:hypothetical protein [Nitrosomonas sp. Is37]